MTVLILFSILPHIEFELREKYRLKKVEKLCIIALSTCEYAI